MHEGPSRQENRQNSQGRNRRRRRDTMLVTEVFFIKTKIKGIDQTFLGTIIWKKELEK